jgi:hypothetical protein
MLSVDDLINRHLVARLSGELSLKERYELKQKISAFNKRIEEIKELEYIKNGALGEEKRLNILFGEKIQVKLNGKEIGVAKNKDEAVRLLKLLNLSRWQNDCGKDEGWILRLTLKDEKLELLSSACPVEALALVDMFIDKFSQNS